MTKHHNIIGSTVFVLFVASLLGVLIGLGASFVGLRVNGWNPELEHKKHSELVREIVKRTENPDAKAFLETTTYDFGLRDVKDKGEHKFVIKNVGTAPLTLEVDRTSCSCTGIDLSSKRVMPGETCIATVHYNAERAMTGPYTQGGVVVTNDPNNREIYLSIKGIFTAPIVLNPQTITFSNMPASETRAASFRIFGFETEPLSLQLSDANWNDREHFDLVLTPSELSELEKENSLYKNAHSVYEGVVTVKPGLPIGTFQEKFQVKTNYSSEPSVEFLARGQIVDGSISIAGSGYDRESGMVRLKTATVGQKMIWSGTIRFSGANSDQVDLKIKAINPDWLKVTLKRPDVSSTSHRSLFYIVSVEIPSNAPVCNYMSGDESGLGIITLETGLSDVPELKIPLQFAVVNP
ncbi:MAG: DUF1573 domain-containing protein [Thermoguttaceae bacterium]